jgi:two-component system, cell cycle sensor histidine kinase and response regulator CckA
VGGGMTESASSGESGASWREEAFAKLAGGLTHELTNVLSASLMLVDLLSANRHLEPRDQALLAAVGESSRRGVGLVRQLLWLARGSEEEATVFQPRHLLADVGKMVHATVPATVAVSSEIPSDLWLLRGDPFQLYRALLAFCHAAGAQLAGGGKLVIGARNQWTDEIAAALRPGLALGAHLIVEVASSGRGGEFPASAASLFAAGGAFSEIETSAEGQVFRLFLPALSPAAEGSPAAEKLSPAGRGELVLVVEGDAAVRQAMTGVLEQHSYRPVAAVDGAEAVALFAQSAPAATVVGTGLTFLDAPGVVRAVRRLREEAPVVATGTEEELAAWPPDLSIRPQALLVKPFSAADLLAALHRILSP